MKQWIGAQEKFDDDDGLDSDGRLWTEKCLEEPLRHACEIKNYSNDGQWAHISLKNNFPALTKNTLNYYGWGPFLHGPFYIAM